MPTCAAPSTIHGKEMSSYQKRIRDIKQVLLSSNATPLWSTICGYKCSYCELKYPQPDNLKAHTLDEHDEFTEIRFLRNPRFTNDIVLKVDITALLCKLCCESLDDLNTLIEHLNIVHKKCIDAEITNRFLPFRFVSQTLCCGICGNTFPSFSPLEHHLNVHMKTYQCNTCNEIFTKKGMLQLHDSMMHKRPIAKKTKKRIELPNNSSYVCGNCGERFPTEYYRRVHMKKVHRKPVFHECNVCDRVFDRRNELTIHTRRDHMMERPFNCSVCSKAFYSKWTMLKHVLSHSHEKNYSCDVCGKKFKFYTSLGPHMLIHKGVKRFECDICHQKFVQKGSWQGHMRNRHKVTV